MSDIAAMVETVPLERASEAHARMIAAGTISDGSDHELVTAHRYSAC